MPRCVCGTAQARKWGHLAKMIMSKRKIKPYNSPLIPVHSEARCESLLVPVPVIWHIISGSCEPILDGNTAMQLGIITFNPQSEVFKPVLMIGTECKQELQDCLQKYPQNFNGLGKLDNHQRKLYVNGAIKLVNVPPRSIPYHLQERVDKLVQEMIEQDAIEEHWNDQTAPWVSNCVLEPKDSGSIRMTIDARNNKALLPTTQPIPPATLI